MPFVGATCNVNPSQTPLDPPDSQKQQSKEKKLPIKEKEPYTKMEFWKALLMQLSQNNPHPRNEVGGHRKDGQISLEERTHLLGRTVTDGLLQCDRKDWVLIKKKVMNLFFD